MNNPQQKIQFVSWEPGQETQIDILFIEKKISVFSLVLLSSFIALAPSLP